jgi:hypothetical protein
LNPDSEQPTAIWVEIPDGFAALPLEDIEPTIGRAEAVLRQVVPDRQRAALAPVTGALSYFLRQLAVRNTLYCGLGNHLSTVDGTRITSTLVVALQEFPEQRDPYLVLRDLIPAAVEPDQPAQVDLVQLAPGPVLFIETTRELPTPTIPGTSSVGVDTVTPVFQLQALVVSRDATKLVTVELSTPFVPYGPEFRTMMVLMASSVSFTAPPTSPESFAAKLEALDG